MSLIVQDDPEQDMGANHYMQTRVQLDTETGHMEGVTKIGTRTDLGGWNGGVSVLLVDANGMAYSATGEERVYGVDGRKIGQSDREIPWSEDFDRQSAQRCASLRILHYYKPSFGAIHNILERLKQIARDVREVTAELRGAGVIN